MECGSGSSWPLPVAENDASYRVRVVASAVTAGAASPTARGAGRDAPSDVSTTGYGG